MDKMSPHIWPKFEKGLAVRKGGGKETYGVENMSRANRITLSFGDAKVDVTLF